MRRPRPVSDLLDNTSLRIDSRSEVQPDAMLLLSEAQGGKSQVAGDGFMQGSPEFIAEVAASSVSYDMHSKLRVYQRNGVQEYLVLLAYEQQIVWHALVAGKYVRLQPGEDGVLRSQVFPGLWLHAEKFWANDVSGLLAVLQEGLRSPEHAEFVARLQGDDQKVQKGPFSRVRSKKGPFSEERSFLYRVSKPERTFPRRKVLSLINFPSGGR